MTARWVVATMDDGVVHEADTKTACLEWLERKGAPIARRIRLARGEYEYATGHPGDTRWWTWWIMTQERAVANGFRADS